MPSNSAAPSLSASVVARDGETFRSWAQAVGLRHRDGDVIYNTDELPHRLKKLVEDSKRFPSWLRDKNAPQLLSIPENFEMELASIRQNLGVGWTVTEENDPLNTELAGSLCAILAILANEVANARETILKPTEADKRRAVDNLMALVWQYTYQGFRYSQECTLQLPQQALVHSTQADSVVFISIENDRPIMTLGVERACSVLPESVPRGFLRVLHWALEYKRNYGTEVVCTRQVLFAMVAGVYQRRAFGFPSDFVFGTVHKPGESLEILAATWAGDPQEVRVYKVATFRLLDPIQMFHFYLFMREARKLAREYANALARVTYDDLKQLCEQKSQIYAWPPKGSKKRGRTESAQSDLESVQEGEGDDMVGVVGVDTPLCLRVVQAVASTDPNDKVMHYLDTLVPGAPPDDSNVFEPLLT